MTGRRKMTRRRGTPSERMSMMNVFEAGEFLGVHYRTLNNWRSHGRGPTYVKMGGRGCYRRSDLEAFVEANLVEGDERKKRN